MTLRSDFRDLMNIMQEFFALEAMCCVCFSLLDDSREKMSDKSKLVTQKVTDV